MADKKLENDSIEELADEVRETFSSQFNPERAAMDSMPSYPFVRETYADYVIACFGGQDYRVGYGNDPKSGKIVFVPRADWQPVQKKETWEDMPADAKAGARHSTADMKTGSAAKEKAMGIVADLESLGFVEARANATKADGLPDGIAPDYSIASIKAVGDRQLQVKIAFTKDSHDERFDQKRTNFDVENFPTPPVSYYHGYDENGRQTAEPIFIGKTIKRETRADGHYIISQLSAGKYADLVWDAALKGRAVASPGGVRHLIRKDKDGVLTYWPVAEIAVWDYKPGDKKSAPANIHSVATPYLKALYGEAGINLPGIALEPDSSDNKINEVKKMDEEFEALLEKKLKEREDKAAADLKMKEDRQKEDAALLETERQKWEAEAVKANRRLPYREGGQTPHQARFADTRKYEGLDVNDLSFMAAVLDGEKRRRPASDGVSNSALKALAIRIAEDKTEANGVNVGNEAREDLKMAGINPADALNATKADELNYSTQAGYGDEWVVSENSRRLWLGVRAATFVVDKLMPGSVVIAEGVESITVPLEGADPTWKKVGQTTGTNATTGLPDATAATSKVGTGQKILTPAKMMARSIYSMELSEDSLIPWAANLRRQMEVSGAEQMENAIVNGDTEAGASTNINDIAGTPAGDEIFMLVNGFRKLGLITNTANKRSAGGAFVDTDFLSTIRLMGVAGKNAQNKKAVDFILDANTAIAALNLASFKTKDVNNNATIENGVLTNAWGYAVWASYQMHAASTVLLANNAGKIDQDTVGNNTLGAMLAVRWDQWLLGWKRKITIKTGELIESDSTQIVASIRFGLAYRDVEAAAITYNILV